MARIKPFTNSNRKEMILKNAAALFREKGFKAASVRELAESVGIEAPSLYNHFGSKADLLRQICCGIAEDFTAHMTAVAASGETPEKKTAALIRFHIRKMHADFDKVYVANHEWKHLSKDLLRDFLSRRKAYENSMQEIITEGIKSGALKNMRPEITVLTILSAVRGLEFRQHQKKGISIKTLEDSMVEHLLTGIINVNG